MQPAEQACRGSDKAEDVVDTDDSDDGGGVTPYDSDYVEEEPAAEPM